MPKHRYAFFDLDMTLHDGYVTSGFYEYLIKSSKIGKKEWESYSSCNDRYSNGEIDYREVCNGIITICAEALSGYLIEEVAAWSQEYVADKIKFFEWVKPLVAYLDERGFCKYVISGGHDFVVRETARQIGIDKFFSSPMIVENGKYTGKLEYVLNFEKKEELVHDILGHLAKDSVKLGWGDSSGDVDMLKQMDLGFVVNTHEEQMGQIARENGFVVTEDMEEMIGEIEKVM